MRNRYSLLLMNMLKLPFLVSFLLPSWHVGVHAFQPIASFQKPFQQPYDDTLRAASSLVESTQNVLARDPAPHSAPAADGRITEVTDRAINLIEKAVQRQGLILSTFATSTNGDNSVSQNLVSSIQQSLDELRQAKFDPSQQRGTWNLLAILAPTRLLGNLPIPKQFLAAGRDRLPFSFVFDEQGYKTGATTSASNNNPLLASLAESKVVFADSDLLICTTKVPLIGSEILWVSVRDLKSTTFPTPIAPAKMTKGTISQHTVNLNDWPVTYYPPTTGPIDLIQYETPIKGCPLEWWYHNCHLTSTETGQEYSLFSSFFAASSQKSFDQYARRGFTGPCRSAHTCTWAIVDVTNQRYYQDALVDSSAPQTIVADFSQDPSKLGKLVENILASRLSDRIATGPAVVSSNGLELNLDDECSIELRAPRHEDEKPHNAKAPSLVWEVHLKNPKTGCAADLVFVPEKPVIRQGKGNLGVVNGMFYYYIPRMRVRGSLSLNGGAPIPVQGQGWYDREFTPGNAPPISLQNDGFATDSWQWMALQLENDTELAMYVVKDKDGNLMEKLLIHTDQNGVRTEIEDFIIKTYSDRWVSSQTQNSYPRKWRLTSDSLDVYVTAVQNEQEFVTSIVPSGAFYEGRVVVEGILDGEDVKGIGFIERKQE